MQITSAASFLKNRSDNSLFFILTDMNAHHTNQLHGLKDHKTFARKSIVRGFCGASNI